MRMPSGEEKRDLPQDLVNCLNTNPQSEFVEADIARVLAVYNGENDGENWRWIFTLPNKRVCYLVGGCDYTGWG